MKRRIPILLFVFIIIACFSSISITLAKYISRGKQSSLIKPDEFYFVSNYEDKEEYEIYKTSLNIEVYNFILDNITNENVSYTIILKEVGGSVIKEYSGTLVGNVKSTGSHPFDGLVVDKTYEIVIMSSSPIIKIMSYKFIVKGTTEIESYYTLVDMGSWIEIDIYVGTVVDTFIAVEYPNDLVADNANDLMKDWYSSPGLIKSITPNTHYKLIFFKTENKTYTNITKGTLVNNNEIEIS